MEWVQLQQVFGGGKEKCCFKKDCQSVKSVKSNTQKEV